GLLSGGALRNLCVLPVYRTGKRVLGCLNENGTRARRLQGGAPGFVCPPPTVLGAGASGIAGLPGRIFNPPLQTHSLPFPAVVPGSRRASVRSASRQSGRSGGNRAIFPAAPIDERGKLWYDSCAL